jgi:hypothetical protein
MIKYIWPGEQYLVQTELTAMLPMGPMQDPLFVTVNAAKG